MATSQAPLKVILVSGACCKPSAFDSFIKALADKGIDAVACPRPSVGADPADTTLAEDTAALRDVIVKHADAGHELIIFAHSYGATVASNAVEGLDRNSRKRDGLPGGIIRIVYATGILMRKGSSMTDHFGEEALEAIKEQVDGNKIYMKDDPEGTFNDLTPEKAREYWKEYVTHNAVGVFKEPSTFEPWSNGFEVSYILTEDDNVTSPQWQELMVEMLGTKSVYRIKAGHMMFLSQPEKTANFIQGLASDYRQLPL
ncbi:hypothetical protein KEM55_000254 [Ascosphaera atra]|nr:hypothetical protein KEM55_000254 [Ascosphaera atra]